MKEDGGDGKASGRARRADRSEGSGAGARVGAGERSGGEGARSGGEGERRGRDADREARTAGRRARADARESRAKGGQASGAARQASAAARQASAAARQASAAGGRGAYHREDLRRELLDRGLSLLARDGLASFSLRALAQDLGVSHAAPYRHFASREELLSAIVGESMDRFEKALLASPFDDDEPEENLFRLGESYVRFYLDNPEILALFNLLPGALAGESGGLAGILSAGEASGGKSPASCPEDDRGFQALARAASAFFSKYPGLSERDVLLGFWAKAHGLACLLASNPKWFEPEGLEAGLARVIRSAF